MEQSKIWGHFQNERKDVFAQAVARYRFLLSGLPRGRVLNIGVGAGGFEREAAATVGDLYSVDPDEKAIARINALGISRGFVAAVDSMPFANDFFDTVICTEVLEHLSDNDLENGLKEVRRILRPGGELLGTVPADEVLSTQETVCPCCGTTFHRWGHVQSFSPQRLEALLRLIGPASVERKLFVNWQSLNWKGQIGMSVRLCLAAFGSWGEGHNLYFRARKSA